MRNALDRPAEPGPKPSSPSSPPAGGSSTPTPPATPPPTRRRVATVVRIQLALFSLYYLWTLYGFTRLTERHGDAFVDAVYENYLGTLVIHHLRVLPAYAIVAAVATLLVYPWARRWRSIDEVARGARRGWGWARPVGAVALADVGLYVLSLGPFFHRNPGIVDGMARKTSRWLDIDHYALFHYHILDGLTLAFGLLTLRAVVFYGRRLARFRWGRVALAAWVAGVVGWVWPRSGPRPTPGPPNVLIIAADSLRWDRLGVHGAARPDITPHIDAFARTAVDLGQMHVATASTLESWFTVVSSQWPPNHGVRYMYISRDVAQRAAATPGLLPRVFGDAGYHTAVVSDWAGNCFQLIDMGFEINRASRPQTFRSLMLETVVWSHVFFPLYFTNALGQWMLPEVASITRYVRPDALTVGMLDEIDAAVAAGKPFFGLVFYSTPHLPYSASHPFNLAYVDPDYRGPHRYEIEVSVDSLIREGFAPDLPPETIDHIRDLYDGTVKEFDHHVGLLLEGLEARGLSDNTIVVITSDHGEDLYDPGSTLGHGTNFFGGDQSTRIPFLIRAPGLREQAGRRVDAVTRNVDVAPTLARLAGVPPTPSWTGVDLVPVMRGEAPDPGLPAFAESCYLFFPKGKLAGLTEAERADLLEVEGAHDTLSIDPDFDDNLVLRADLHDGVIAAKDMMVRTPRWKLIEIPGRSGPIRRLYDMVADPGQTEDLAGRGWPIEAALAEALEAYRSGRGAAVRWPASKDEQPPRSAPASGP